MVLDSISIFYHTIQTMIILVLQLTTNIPPKDPKYPNFILHPLFTTMYFLPYIKTITPLE